MGHTSTSRNLYGAREALPGSRHPVARFIRGPEVTRPSPDSPALRLAFTHTCASFEVSALAATTIGVARPIPLFDRNHPSVPTCTSPVPSRAAAVKDGPSSGHRVSGAKRP